MGQVLRSFLAGALDLCATRRSPVQKVYDLFEASFLKKTFWKRDKSLAVNPYFQANVPRLKQHQELETSNTNFFKQANFPA